MGSFSGNLQRPLFTAAAVAVASVTTDLLNKITNPKQSELLIASEALPSLSQELGSSSLSSWVSDISVSKLARLSFVTKIQVPMPNIDYHPIPNSSCGFSGKSTVACPLLANLYQSAELAKASRPKTCDYSNPSMHSEDLYRWHLPEPSAVVDVAGQSDCCSAKSRTVVVLLGWLGAKQKHLSKYAEWYTSKGFHVITFTFPISEVLSYQVGGKAEQDVELLVNHLAEWLEEEHGKNIVFHTFSNTGWLTYGVALEKFQKQDPSLIGRIKGCIVDSAPVAAADPQVFASGFSAALLKKQSIATKGSTTSSDASEKGFVVASVNEQKPAATETALLVLLEKFFQVVLNLPPVNRRLTDVMGLLSSKQPSCPQLYIYSSSDRVIPASCVESFMEQQRKSGYEVRSCNFVSTPHVDHFRNNPHLYTSQLTLFLENCVLKCCKGAF